MAIGESEVVNTDMNAQHSDHPPHVGQARPRGAHELAEALSSGAQKRLGRLDPSRRSSVENRLAQTPPKSRLGYLAAVEGRASPRAAIKAFCLECVGWQRSEVTACTALACPLWAYRPFRKA